MRDTTLHLLLVGDAASMPLVTAAGPSDDGWHVRLVPRLGDAMAALHEAHHDVVLLALDLPDSRGLDTLRELVDRHPGVPVVVLTDTDDDGLVARAVAGGAQAVVVQQSTSPGTLRRTITQAVERQQLLEAIRASGRHSQILVELAQEALVDPQPDRVADLVVRALRRATDRAAHAVVLAQRHDRLTPVAPSYLRHQSDHVTRRDLALPAGRRPGVPCHHDRPRLSRAARRMLEVDGESPAACALSVDIDAHDDAAAGDLHLTLLAVAHRPEVLDDETTRFVTSLAAMVAMALRRHRAEAALVERVKELTALAGLTRALEHATTAADVATTTASRLVPAMQWPEHARAEVLVDDARVSAGGEGAARTSLSTDLVSDGRWRGRLTVGYTTDLPFLDEEQALLDAMAEAITIWLHREHATSSLRASEERFRLIAESAQDVVYRVMLEPEVDVEYLNPAIEDVLGLSRDVAMKDPMAIVRRCHPDDMATITLATLGDGATHTSRVRARHTDGHWVTIEDRRTGILVDGRLVGVQGIARDVTARQRSETALRQALEQQRRANEELQAVNTRKSLFLQTASHELRTPLTSLMGYSRTLRSLWGRLDEAQIAHFLDRLTLNADRLDRLVTDLLDLERARRGLVEVQPRRVDVAALVRELASMLASDDTPVEVRGRPEVVVSVDPGLVDRIVTNLVDNVRRHTPPGTPAILDVEHQDDRLVLTVDDTGPGIDPAIRDRVLLPFEQGPAAAVEPSPGLGIGLALVHQMAVAMRGHLELQDRPGGGSRVVVSLPLGPDQPPLPRIAMYSAMGPPDPADAAAHLVREALHAVMHTTCPEELTGSLMSFVYLLGGDVSTDATTPGALDHDLSLGTADPILVVPPSDELRHAQMRRWLPFLIDAARLQAGALGRPDGRVTGSAAS